MAITVDSLINDFAVRSFRDVADADYIAARMACRAALTTQYLWASQQAVEKYLKSILLLNRIPAKDVRHDLGKALGKIEESGKVTLDLTKGTREFIKRLDEYGSYRYFEVSNVGFGAELVTLDRDTKAHVAETSPQFAQWDLVLGRTPVQSGSENAKYANSMPLAIPPFNSGIVISDSHASGTIPRNGLAWAFDFFDHGGRVASNLPGFRDIGNGSAFIMSCHGPGLCGDWNSGQGTSLQTFGATVANNGYAAQLISAVRDKPQTIALGASHSTTGGLTLINAPAAMRATARSPSPGYFGSTGLAVTPRCGWQGI